MYTTGITWQGSYYTMPELDNISSRTESTSVSVFEDDEEENLQTCNVALHRGYQDAPENTLPALIEAAENGYDTVEIDLSWTKDGVPVLLHDETINRTAKKENGNGIFFRKKCSNMTYDELLKYDFGIKWGKEYAGTKIPTLQETLDCAEENGLNLYIELKETDDFNSEKAQILADMVNEAGLADKITWISFNSDYLKEISEVLPEARLGYLTKKKVTEKTIDTLSSLQNDTNEVFLDIKSSKITEKGDALLDEAGFGFEVWTVDDLDDLDDIAEFGCSGVTTNTLSLEDAKEHLQN